MAKFKATFAGLKVDKEGEVTVKFKVPQSDQAQVIAVSMLTETLVNVEVTPYK